MIFPWVSRKLSSIIAPTPNKIPGANPWVMKSSNRICPRYENQVCISFMAIRVNRISEKNGRVHRVGEVIVSERSPKLNPLCENPRFGKRENFLQTESTRSAFGQIAQSPDFCPGPFPRSLRRDSWSHLASAGAGLLEVLGHATHDHTHNPRAKRAGRSHQRPGQKF